MKRNFLELPHLAAATMMAAALVSLSGCITDDALTDDSRHHVAHSSEAYPLQAMRGKGYKCGQWPEDLTATSENQAYYNHGCAVQANIAAEIANPSTLTTPHATDLPMGASAATAVRNVTSASGNAKSGGGLASLFGSSN